MKVIELKAILEKFNDNAMVEIQVSEPGDEPRWAEIRGEAEFTPVTPDHCLLQLGDVVME